MRWFIGMKVAHCVKSVITTFLRLATSSSRYCDTRGNKFRQYCSPPKKIEFQMETSPSRIRQEVPHIIFRVIDCLRTHILTPFAEFPHLPSRRYHLITEIVIQWHESYVMCKNGNYHVVVISDAPIGYKWVDFIVTRRIWFVYWLMHRCS